ncbi:MAG: hypothetical protein ACYCVB_12885 [Bacilli bacterium]
MLDQPTDIGVDSHGACAPPTTGETIRPRRHFGLAVDDGQNATDPEPAEPAELAPRRVAHPKERITAIWLIRKAVSPLQPAPRPNRKLLPVHRQPEQIASTTRYGARRRTKRLRMALRLRIIKIAKRVGYSTLTATLAILLTFWAKFAVVYNIPTDLQTGALQHVQEYIVFKSWWFGPPEFNLSGYPNINPLSPRASLATDLQNYRDIITNPNEIVWTWSR